MANAVAGLIEKLKTKQGDMTEAAFTEALGVSRGIWFMIKGGQRSPGLDFLKAVIRKYPELQLDVYRVMSEAPETATANGKEATK